MRIAFLATLFLLIVPAAVPAQQRSACEQDVPPGVLLNICEHWRGMPPLPQPRLYFRLYKDGRAEIETRKTSNELTKKELRIKEDAVREIKRLGARKDVQKASAAYPSFLPAYDSTYELIINVYGETGQKQIILENFVPGEGENKRHYPASLLLLMERVEELSDIANGVVRKIPNLSFCTLMADREYFTGKRVKLHADMELGIGVGTYLHEPECDQPEAGSARTHERIGFGYDEEKLGKGPVIRELLQKKGYETYVPHVRVWVEGILREETQRGRHNFPYKFIIERVLNVDDIVVAWGGELRQGWVYADTIDHKRGRALKLSWPLQPLIHHAQRVEWTNADKFPALRRSGRKYISFRVVSKETRQMARYRWNDVYTCEIVTVVER